MVTENSTLKPQAHEAGDIHIHDLGSLSVYCVGWDLADLLEQGFTGAVGKATSGPPGIFEQLWDKIVNFFYTLQGEAAGAQAFMSLDTHRTIYQFRWIR